MHEYPGEFEIHITAEADAPKLAAFQQWCGDQGFKCVRIVLSRGDHVEQPMATWRRFGAILSSVLEEAQRHAAALDQTGIPVVRVKIEATPRNGDIPELDSQAQDHGPKNYFEHHIKLLREVNAPVAELVKLCEGRHAHLSRNAFRQPSEGMEERFVTQRAYQIGRRSSEEQLNLLLGELRKLGERILEYESEYCVYDSNLDLDAGWLPNGCDGSVS